MELRPSVEVPKYTRFRQHCTCSSEHVDVVVLHSWKNSPMTFNIRRMEKGISTTTQISGSQLGHPRFDEWVPLGKECYR